MTKKFNIIKADEFLEGTGGMATFLRSVISVTS